MDDTWPTKSQNNPPKLIPESRGLSRSSVVGARQWPANRPSSIPSGDEFLGSSPGALFIGTVLGGTVHVNSIPLLISLPTPVSHVRIKILYQALWI